MPSTVKISSADGFEFNAYLSEPEGISRGGLVILQEIFGVNDYIRFVADEFAKAGYRTIAPALFDRIESGIEYSFEQAPLARETLAKTDQEKVLEDIEASIHFLNQPQGVAVLGFCWGGLLSFLSASRFNTICNIAYYGGRTQNYLSQLPRSPIQFHFGDQDTHISLVQVEDIEAAMVNSDTEAEFHIYPCGHGFDNHTRASYHEPSSSLARQRSIEFLNKHFSD